MTEAVLEKLKILAAAAKYDVSCSSSGTVRRNSGNGVGNTVGGGSVYAIVLPLTAGAYLC